MGKFEELRREAVATDLLLQKEISLLREIVNWHYLPFTEEYLTTFFKDYWINPEVDGLWSHPPGYITEDSDDEHDP